MRLQFLFLSLSLSYTHIGSLKHIHLNFQVVAGGDLNIVVVMTARYGDADRMRFGMACFFFSTNCHISIGEKCSLFIKFFYELSCFSCSDAHVNVAFKMNFSFWNIQLTLSIRQQKLAQQK